MKKEFLIPSLLSEVQKASERILSFLRPLGLTEGQQFDIRLCLEEALINAMKYGNRLREDLSVRLVAEYGDRWVKITVEDQGTGFDPCTLRDCTAEPNILRNSGRGVFLIHHLMDEVKYNAKGNILQMVKFLRKEEAKTESSRG